MLRRQRGDKALRKQRVGMALGGGTRNWATSSSGGNGMGWSDRIGRHQAGVVVGEPGAGVGQSRCEYDVREFVIVIP